MSHSQFKSPLLKRLAPVLSQSPYHGAKGLILAVSGGMDSMVLCDVFVRLAHLHGAPLRVIHVHHGTGTFADCSEQLVRDFCVRQQLAFEVVPFRHDGDGSFEYAAARFRQSAMEARRTNGEYVVLAHHREDQAETILQTLVRGAGLATPLGMSSNRDSRLRPFLDVPRTAIAEHARLLAVPHLLDPTNHHLGNIRNLIRHRVLPDLENCHGNVSARLGGFAEELRGLRGALEAHAKELFDQHYQKEANLLPRKLFATTRPYLWDFLLRFFWETQNVAPPKRQEASRVRQWLSEGRSGTLDHAGARLYVDLDGLAFEASPAHEPCQAVCNQLVEWGAWRLMFHRVGPGPDAFTLLPHGPMPHQIKEQLRCMRTPHRVRANLPRIQCHHQSVFLHQLSQHSSLRLKSIQPVYLSEYFRDRGDLP